MPYLPGVGRCCDFCMRPLAPTKPGNKKYCSEKCYKEAHRKQNREAYRNLSKEGKAIYIKKYGGSPRYQRRERTKNGDR